MWSCDQRLVTLALLWEKKPQSMMYNLNYYNLNFIRIWPEKPLFLRGVLGSSSIIWDWQGGPFYLFTLLAITITIAIDSNYFCKKLHLRTLLLCKKGPYSELLWSAFFSHFPVFSSNVEKCGKYADQNNSEHGFFLRSVITYNNVFQFHWNAVLCQGCYNILLFQIALNIVLSHSPRQVARIH